MCQATPLLSDETYGKLLAKREEIASKLGADSVGCVMMPCGPKPGDGPRVLWVGRAPLGGKPAPEELTPQYRLEYFPEWLSEKPSAFWRFIRKTMTAALRRLRPHDEEPNLLHHVGWTNLALIANGAKAHPDKRSLAEQSSLCVTALTEAIETMKPTSVVLVNNDHANHIVTDAKDLPPGAWNPIAPFPEQLQYTEKDQIRFIWTLHPQHLQGLGIFDSVSDRLAQVI
jgi:hypothetical protein